MGKVTVECPLCRRAIEVTEYDTVTRSDALVGHVAAVHVGKIMPPTPDEGPPLPKALGIKWPWREHSNPGLAGPLAAAMTVLKLEEKPKPKPKPAGLRW